MRNSADSDGAAQFGILLPKLGSSRERLARLEADTTLLVKPRFRHFESAARTEELSLFQLWAAFLRSILEIQMRSYDELLPICTRSRSDSAYLSLDLHSETGGSRWMNQVFTKVLFEGKD